MQQSQDEEKRTLQGLLEETKQQLQSKEEEWQKACKETQGSIDALQADAAEHAAETAVLETSLGESASVMTRCVRLSTARCLTHNMVYKELLAFLGPYFTKLTVTPMMSLAGKKV